MWAILIARHMRFAQALRVTSRWANRPAKNSSRGIAQGGAYNPSLVWRLLRCTIAAFSCTRARSGKEIYGKQRIDPEAGAFTASPWAYNGKIFALSEDGVTYVIRAGEKCGCCGRTRSMIHDGHTCIFDDSLIVRTASALYKFVTALFKPAYRAPTSPAGT